MPKYRIKSLYAENFKLIDRTMIDFENADLLVLDGPNGFGKTTIFDALELIISKKINRNTKNITSDLRTGFEYSPYVKDNSKDLFLAGEFVDKSGKVFSIIRYLTHSNNDTKLNRPEAFNRFETFYYDGSINETLLEKDQIKTKEELLEAYSNKIRIIITYPQNDNFIGEGFKEGVFNFYNNFYYIEQENNTYYLKLPEKDRIKEIDSLFGTGTEKQEQDKINELLKRIRNEHSSISNKINLIDKQLEKIESEITTKGEYEEVYFNSLFKECGVEKDWDKEDLLITEENKVKIDDEIQQLEHFVRFHVDYKNERFNKSLDGFILKEDIIQNALVLGYWIQNNEELYNKIVQKYSDWNQLVLYNTNLQRENILEKVNDGAVNKIKEIIGGTHDYETIKTILKNISLKKQGSGDISKIIQTMKNTSVTFMKTFEEVRNKTEVLKNECPLCGYPWETYELMIKSIEGKREALSSLLDSTAHEIEEQLDSLFKNHIDSLLTSIRIYQGNKANIVNKDFYIQLTEAYKQKVDVDKYIKWCFENKFEISHLYNQKKELYNFTNEIYQNICEGMRNLRKIISSEFVEADKLIDTKLKNIFDSCFGGKEENIKLVTLDQIKNKKKYIEKQYFSAVLNKKQSLIIEKNAENTKLDVIEKWTKGTKPQDNKNRMPLQLISEIYSKEISERHRKLIQDVEIPFYLFSGKILQNYQKGMGVFMDTGEDKGVTKSIRFISDTKNKHDLIHCMSSGQLAGVVIAWSLALNKVYSSENNFDAILIDDPVQTMDDINMASLVDLLRNEFADKQLIISTHEDYVSRYIRYKFRKSGLTEKCINVKDYLT